SSRWAIWWTPPRNSAAWKRNARGSKARYGVRRACCKTRDIWPRRPLRWCSRRAKSWKTAARCSSLSSAAWKNSRTYKEGPMNIWHNISPERIRPDTFTAVVEISKGDKNKYELDKETGLLRLDRVLYTSTH